MAPLIPLLAGLAPSIVDLIAALTHRSAPVAEATFGAKAGPVKLATVLSDVMVDLQRAAAAGTIPKELPSDQTISTVVQSVISSMKLSGLLDSPTQPAAPQATQGASYVLKPGQSVTITVG
jgi:D-alanyl-D-alanine dipeptidase